MQFVAEELCSARARVKKQHVKKRLKKCTSTNNSDVGSTAKNSHQIAELDGADKWSRRVDASGVSAVVLLEFFGRAK